MRALLAALLALLAIAAPAIAAAPAAADVDDFSFSSMEVDYILGRDDDGRSTLTTVERLTAEFPNFDQNRGILRALPEVYEGTPTELAVVSVTDEDRTPREYEAESEDGFLELTIAGEDYVQGTQVYVITYEQRNVTLFPDDADVEEFYWDVNGTGWAQPFGQVTARLSLEDDLADSLTGDAACYVGAEGATARCDIVREDAGEGTLLTAGVRDLAPYENMTISVGFEPGTFTPRDSSLFASPFAIPLLASVALLLAAIAAAVVHRVTRLRDAPGRPVTVPEYLPLAEPDLLVSSVLLHKQSRGVAATLVSLAVRGVLRIVEVEAGRKPKFALELLDRDGRPRFGSGPRGASAAENRLMDAVFGAGDARPRVVLDPKDTALSRRIHNATTRRSKDAVAQGYQRKPPTRPWVILAIAGGVGLTLTALFAILLLDDARGGWLPAIALLLVPLGVLTWILPARRPLTSTGAEVRDHLLG
ncbi:MAG TPA: DUF2207 domain-containing protein, partial [Naasia sp.]